MGILWGALLNLALVLFIINAVIRFRQKRRPPEPDAHAMFGTVTTSFGGGDFLGAALVVLVNMVGGQVATAFAGTEFVPPEELRTDLVSPEINWPLAWLIQGTQVGANWAIIAWRNAKFLDWKWSGAAAFLIPVAGFALALVIGIVVTM